MFTYCIGVLSQLFGERRDGDRFARVGHGSQHAGARRGQVRKGGSGVARTEAAPVTGTRISGRDSRRARETIYHDNNCNKLTAYPPLMGAPANRKA